MVPTTTTIDRGRGSTEGVKSVLFDSLLPGLDQLVEDFHGLFMVLVLEEHYTKAEPKQATKDATDQGAYQSHPKGQLEGLEDILSMLLIDLRGVMGKVKIG